MIHYTHQYSPDAFIAFSQIDRREMAIAAPKRHPETILSNKMVLQQPHNVDL